MCIYVVSWANQLHGSLLPRKITWPLHIDINKILAEDSDTSQETWLNTGYVTLLNHEALALRHNTQRPFHECIWFKRNRRSLYSIGNNAARLTAGAGPDRSHCFTDHQGEAIALTADGPYSITPTLPLERWHAKFMCFGEFSNLWFDDTKKPSPFLSCCNRVISRRML